MTMATETENNGPDSKEIKDVKEMKEALKDDAPPDNKQEEKDAAAKKDEAAGKKDDDAAAAAAGGATAAPAKANIVHHPDYEKDVVYLYQFPRTPLLPSLSPYGLKVETWLRLNGIKYEVSVAEHLPFFLPPLASLQDGRIAAPSRFPYCVRACVRTWPSVRSFACRCEGGSIAFILIASRERLSLSFLFLGEMRRNSARALDRSCRGVFASATAYEIAPPPRETGGTRGGSSRDAKREAGVNDPPGFAGRRVIEIGLFFPSPPSPPRGRSVDMARWARFAPIVSRFPSHD